MALHGIDVVHGRLSNSRLAGERRCNSMLMTR